MKAILKWQYDQLVKELLLLQEHQTDPSCPCATDGEMCVRKHLLAIEGYAQETMAMEENQLYKNKLQVLATEAQSYREQEEQALRGEAEHVELIKWSRDWRKEFETYSLGMDKQGKGKGKEASCTK
ncbi:MAG: hypothetical protein GX922_00170 [Firmicutes bacterium]|nr:hypothetical protein [Bacillota bacterium]